MNILKYMLPIALLVPVAVASAQQQTAAPARAQPQQAQQPQLTPEQKAQLAKQDQEIGKAAAQIVQLVDQGRLAEVWAGASPVVKAVVPEADFVRSVSDDRKRAGAATERKLAGITRTAYKAGGNVPPGNYINVAYATRFASVQQPMRELVSFRLDDDKVWRVSGYSLR